MPRPFPGAVVADAQVATPPAAAGQTTPPVTTGATDEPRPVPSTDTDAAVVSPNPSPGTPANTIGGLALHAALEFRGVRYRNGGSDPSGFDCSGLVQYVFAQQGIALPREVRQQYAAGYEINRDEVRPGDLLFFNTDSNGASHVAIAIDQASFVHAPNSRGVVRVERIATAYWATRFLSARRIE